MADGVFDDYTKLGNAIVVRAARDLARVYADFRRIILRGEKIERMEEYRAYGIERFFFSDLYNAITEINGQKIIELLRKEAGIEKKNSLDWRVTSNQTKPVLRRVR